MKSSVKRQTTDLSAYPDMVVIYLGMKARSPRGIKTLISFGPNISKAVAEKPDGLLLHENILFGLFPPHAGMRQYWRDFESLEAWSRSLPHKQWWQQFLRDSGGAGFWHETYFMRGGMETIYDDVSGQVGMMKFAPLQPARGAIFSARRRLGVPGEERVPAPVSEGELYDERVAGN
ncbi:MAG: phenylacetaldoxime dehydratase family protein [Chloroflexi bacterium]|nr:phenylacetaldoxime dehydratase family protein [Chloroflexota bacterium]